MRLKDFFLIVGCQRSGTTLVRLILECHSRVGCFDELTSYQILAQGMVPDMHRGESKSLGFKIPRWTEQLDDPILADEGEPYTATQFYSGQKIVFMLRDVRDTVASMAKLKSGGTAWIDAWPERIFSAKREREERFAREFQRELEQVENCCERTYAMAGLYWKYKTLAFFRYEQRGYPVLGVRYGELVKNPEPVLRRICEFLNIDFQPKLLNHPAFCHPETFENGLTIGNTDPQRPIHAESFGQWTHRLTARQTEAILAIAGDTQARFEERWPLEARAVSCKS